MATLPEFSEGTLYYVSNPEGLENIPQGTILKITVVTQGEIRLAVPKKAGGGVLDISPDEFRSNCKYDWRDNKTIRDMKHLEIKRRAELLDGDDRDCKLRRTDTVQDVLILMRKAAKERERERFSAFI